MNLTVTIEFWFWPAALFVLGIVIAVVDDWRDGGGLMSGCMGAAICLACWTLAAGLALGRWLA